MKKLGFLFVVSLCLLPIAAFAQTDQTLSDVVAAAPAPAGPIADRNEFGTGQGTDEWLPAMTFTPRSASLTWTYVSNGYMTSSTGGQFEHELPLHNGNLLMGYRIFYNDSSAANGLTVRIHEYNYDNLTHGSTTTIPYTWSSSGSAGFDDVWVNTGASGFTVDMRDGSTDRFYTVAFVMPADANVSVKGVRLFWYRQVSPAPATATYTDVPTTSPIFKFVEALSAAGITGGCGNNLYCPNAPLTRGQMAVFLSTALGLHWAY